MDKEVIIDGIKYVPECKQKIIKLGPVVDTYMSLNECYCCRIEISKSIRCIIEIEGNENYVTVKGKHNLVKDNNYDCSSSKVKEGKE